MTMPKNIYEEFPLLNTKSIKALDKLMVKLCELIMKTYADFDNDIARIHPINYTQIIMVNLIINQFKFSLDQSQPIPERLHIIREFLDMICTNVMELWLAIEACSADETIAN